MCVYDVYVCLSVCVYVLVDERRPVEQGAYQPEKQQRTKISTKIRYVCIYMFVKYVYVCRF